MDLDPEVTPRLVSGVKAVAVSSAHMESIMKRTLLVTALALLPVTHAHAHQDGQDKIPVLIASGANNHDWRWTTPSIESMLDESGLFDVTITYDPATDLADEKSLARYKALVLDYNGPRWGPDAEASFLKAVRGGVGVAVIHAANNAFPGWVEFEQLVGHLWRAGTGHGRFHPFGLEVLDYDHPITATMPDFVDHPDELYHRLVRVEGYERTVIGVSHSSKESGGTGDDEPMIIVGAFGKGRFFHTPLAHVWSGQEQTKVSHHDPQLRTLIVRGTEWAATGAVTDGLAQPNHLSLEEAQAGWRLLFDGQSTRGWHRAGGEGFPDKGWTIQSGCLRNTSGGGDLLSDDTYRNFELAFEWKVARGTNSGVKYRVRREGNSLLGPEFQILDDAGTNEDDNPLSAAGSLYALTAAQDKQLQHAGQFNQSRIVCRGEHLEHWLNGQLILSADVGSEDWAARLARSKFRSIPEFASERPGHILLQDHGGEVWYRSIRIRDLDLQDNWESLLQDEGLDGWTVAGGARYVREGNTIIGDVNGRLGRNSFLVTDEIFADFQFQVEVRIVERGNSGIQFRSHYREKDGVVFGYQAEIDEKSRAWSGGIFEEGRRGWLDDLRDNPAGRQAFRMDEWNHYFIQAEGNDLRVWVNGVSTAHLVDDKPLLKGFLGLQVHGGKSGRFHWRNPRLRRL